MEVFFVLTKNIASILSIGNHNKFTSLIEKTLCRILYIVGFCIFLSKISGDNTNIDKWDETLRTKVGGLVFMETQKYLLIKV